MEIFSSVISASIITNMQRCKKDSHLIRRLSFLIDYNLLLYCGKLLLAAPAAHHSLTTLTLSL